MLRARFVSRSRRPTRWLAIASCHIQGASFQGRVSLWSSPIRCFRQDQTSVDQQNQIHSATLKPFRTLMTHVLDLQVPSLIRSINSRIASSTYRLADETTLAKLLGCGSNLSAGSL